MTSDRVRRVVAALDKFRGTATAAEACRAVGDTAARLGWRCDEVPMSDGGDGLLDVLGGPNRTTTVTGPLGDPIEAAWRLDRRSPQTAVIESARACGLALVGGAEHNDAVAASTTGVGELIDHAVAAGATRIIVGLGGSATTDGGFGAVRAIAGPHRLRGVELLVACDVSTTFVDAARVFAPQKGASARDVEFLTRRLQRLVQVYAEQYGRPIADLPGSGAAGGLAGGLAALGGRLVGGFDLVADLVDLPDKVADADLVITGEGFLDDQSFAGKVVGGVVDVAHEAGVEVAVICGDADIAPDDLRVIRLIERYGEQAAFEDTVACLRLAADEILARR